MAANANDIDDAFVTQFESEVKLAYQRMGSQLRPTCRQKLNIVGSTDKIQKMGTVIVGPKTRNGDVNMSDQSHDSVDITITDKYGGRYVDSLDELKINHDERGSVTQSIAWALGRESDQVIVDSIDGHSNATTSTGAITQAKFEEIYEYYGNNDVPDDRNRYASVSPQGWTDLMGLSVFANEDYVPSAELPWAGTMTRPAKFWFNFWVFTFSGLSKAGAVRTSHTYHHSGVCYGSGSEARITTDWENTKQAYSIVGSISMGSVIVEDEGVYNLDHTEA